MNIKMKICGECGEFHYTTEISCPHCESQQRKSTTTISKAALLLGLGLTLVIDWEQNQCLSKGL